ncbi:MAG: DUF4291 domain-containing protein [Planctomycetes bacterium]|nr:DUF4291 domain-containing protein [Planctomycetota bacterium]
MHLEPYVEQRRRWPEQGRHVLAHFDDDSIVVYQAFRPQIADEAVRLGRFGPSFLRSRMSWLKPNFLWMMYRCGWATKVDQERVLAVRLPRPFFDRLLALAVSAWFDPTAGLTEAEWSRAVASSDVRLQWDPDHNPGGSPLARRAVQLGLRRTVLAEYADRAILSIEDVTPLVVEQRAHAKQPWAELRTPSERVYLPGDPALVRALALDSV